MHAGREKPDASPLWGTSICSRCHRTDLRLIGGNICVGCKNREYECLKGKNAKGKAPVKHPRLERRSVRYVVAGEVKTLVRANTVSADELVVELLRDSGGRVLLGRGCPNVNAKVVKQGALF
jgi:hypothetical protein